MTFFQHQDLEIHYETFGDPKQPSLVFSNSLGTNYGMWQKQINALKKSFYLICYDTRGHGHSSTPDGAYQLSQLGEDVIALLNHLGIRKAFFCGISMGGLIGQWLAIHHPERFEKILIANTAAKIGTASAWHERANLVRQQGLKPIADSAANRWFTPEFIENHCNLISTLRNDLAIGSAAGYANCCEALAQTDLRTDIENITLPVIIIAGQQDPVTTVDDAQFMHQRIAQSQLFELNASHISNIEQADQFNDIIMNTFRTAQ